MEQLLRQTDIQQALECSRTTLWRLRKAGELPRPLRIGGRLLWRRSQFERWLAARAEDK